ncbi:MAG: AAA family ATPase [Nitriliruptorales bacterium]
MYRPSLTHCSTTSAKPSSASTTLPASSAGWHGSSTTPRYSTPELLATEQRLVDAAGQRAADKGARVDHASLERVLAAHPTLLADQAAMVERLATSGAGVDVVVGKAGSGKSFALRAARESWESQSIRVVGCALAARAAQELERGSGILSTTIARMLVDLDHPEHGGLERGSVLVVDEAGMVGTRVLARLLQHAEDAGAKVVLVGDHHQLPEIDAGGAFRALANRLPAVELTDNRRQREPWERTALDELRHGSTVTAIDAYTSHDRIHVAETQRALREQLVGDWWNAVFEHGVDAIMVAARRADVADLKPGPARAPLQRGRSSDPSRRPAGAPSRPATGSSASATTPS